MTKNISTDGIPFNQYWLKKKEKCLGNFKAVRNPEDVEEHCLPSSFLCSFITVRCLFRTYS